MDKTDQTPGSSPATAIVIPRPKKIFTRHSSIRLMDVDAYQQWMQDYHKHHQLNRNQRLCQSLNHSSASSTVSSVSSNRSLTRVKKPKGSNLFLNFNSMKINTDDNNNTNIVKDLSILSPRELKTEPIMDNLDGYKIYKGNVKNGSTVTSLDSSDIKQISPDSTSAIVPTQNSIILPDKFTFTTVKPNGLTQPLVRLDNHQYQPINSHNNNINHNRTTQQNTSTSRFHIHLQQSRRSRSLSASTDSSNGNSFSPPPTPWEKTMLSPRETSLRIQQPQQTLYRTPSVTTIQLHSNDTISFTPRNTNSIHLAASVTSHFEGLNNDTRSEYVPKSILKNHKDSMSSSVSSTMSDTGTIFQNKNSSSSTMSKKLRSFQRNSNRSSKHSLKRSPSPQLKQTFQKPTINVMVEARRPKSASATSSKYELVERSSLPRRKSVTFNSYVSFLSDSRISTIRSLPVDV